MKLNYHRVILAFASLLLVISSAFTSNPSLQSQDSEGVSLKVTQVDTSRFPQVVVYVSAVDAFGEPAFINPGNIVLRENGNVMKADLVEGAGDSGPLTTMLVMDISGSMNSGNKMTMAKKVAKEYVSQMRSNDLAGIIAFNSQVKEVQAVTSEHDVLQNAIDSLRAKDDTAMYDALIKAADILDPLDGRKAVIVLTDGLDNRSKHTPTDVINSIGGSGLSISTIGLGNPGQSTGNITALDEKTLNALAEKAGGSYSLATDQASLQLIYEKYGRALRSEYAVTYTSQSTLRDGINRSLSVSLEAGGISSWTEPVNTNFNPGGLVPEVAEGASWPTFFILFAGLLVLLFLPTILRLFNGNKAQTASTSAASMQKKPTRVKLK